MHVNKEKGTPLNDTFRQQVIINFCQSVLRSDHDLLKQAINRYQQSLTNPARR